MSRYVDANRTSFGVEPICQVLAVAPSSYYAAKSRPPSARALRDQELKLVMQARAVLRRNRHLGCVVGVGTGEHRNTRRWVRGSGGLA